MYYKRKLGATKANEVRKQVRLRDGACVVCGMTTEQHVEYYGRALDVHRIVPGSEYTLEGCVAVCRYCHGAMPKSRPLIRRRYRT